MSDALFTNGCSYVVGHELKDLTRIDRFSNLVAKHFGWFDWNEGKVGAGNGRIMRTTINSILQNNVYYFRKKEVPGQVETYENVKIRKWFDREIGQRDRKPKVAVIMWSGVNRLETLTASKEEKNVFNYKLDYHWSNGFWSKFQFDPKHLTINPSSQCTWDPWSPEHVKKAGTDYMKIRNMVWAFRDTINNMLAVKYFLEAQEIPQLHYLFCGGQYKPLLHILDIPTFEASNIWWETLDLNKEQVLKELPFLESEGFLEMTERLRLPIGERGHPLEEAHEAMATRIIKDINGIYKENN